MKCIAPALVAIVILVAGQASAQDSKPSSRPASRPDAKPASRPMATGSKQALALARRVHQFAGGWEGLSKVKNLVFTFQARGRKRWFWDFGAQKVRVEYPEAPRRARGAGLSILVYDIQKDENVLRLPPRPHPNAPRISAEAGWINDTYWLLVTLKVLDPGVKLSIDPRQKGDLASIQRLRLRFAKGVGHTPQNEYVLHVEADTGRVTRWDYFRRAGARPRSWEFADYRRVGPLRLSLSRPQVGDTRRRLDIKLVDVQVNVKVPEKVWISSERLFLKETKKEK